MSRHLPDAIDAAIRSFESNRLIRKVAAEEATPRDYVALLLTLYHQVKSSAVTFAAAAAAAAGRSRDAAEYLMDHAHEEAGHYRWILNDLDAAGYDGPGPEALPIPKPTLAYIGVNHHCAAHWPLSRLAIAAFLEGVSGRLGSAYGLLAAMGQLVVLLYGIYLISIGDFTAGFLVSFFMYVTTFYDPLRQLAALWAGFQVAIAGWDRISHILRLESDLTTLPAPAAATADKHAALLEFRHVSFHYPNGKEVLRNISFRMQQGKTYALVGPTGGFVKQARLIAVSHLSSKLLSGKAPRTYTQSALCRADCAKHSPGIFTGSAKAVLIHVGLAA